MKCKICVQFSHQSEENVWITGTNNFKRYALVKHGNSSLHKEDTLKKVNTAKPSSAPAPKSLLALNQHVVKKLEYLFKNAHAVAKKGKSYKDYEWLCELDEAKGLPIGNTYRNDKQAAIFVEHIADIERRRLREKINSANFISIITDGSTDSAVKEAEIVFIRHCKDGVVETNFLGVKNVTKPDADHITEALLSLLKENLGTFWKTKMIGIATDGAAVMTGKNAGVVTKIKQYLAKPNLVAIHCSAHRLELAYKQACKHAPLFAEVDAMLIGLYYFYYRSPLNRSNLVESYKSQGRSPLIPTRVGGTRWVQHVKKAISNLLADFEPIMQHLEQVSHRSGDTGSKISGNKAKGLLKVLQDRNKLAFLYFLLDVVNALAKASESFQDRSAPIYVIAEEIAAIQVVLKNLKTTEGPFLRKVISDLKEETHHGIHLKGTKSLKAFENSREALIENLLENLKTRFEGEDIITASHITRPCSWPKDFTAKPDFGDKDVQLLVEKCGEMLESNGFNPGEVEQEWTSLKSYISKRVDPKTIPDLVESYGDRCRNLFGLIDLLLAIPAASAEAERGFSIMKKTKNDWRSSLQDGHLSDQMIIQLESKNIGDYDPSETIELWLTSGEAPRRPCYKDRSAKDSGTGICPSPISDDEGEDEENAAWAKLIEEI